MQWFVGFHERFPRLMRWSAFFEEKKSALWFSVDNEDEDGSNVETWHFDGIIMRHILRYRM